MFGRKSILGGFVALLGGLLIHQAAADEPLSGTRSAEYREYCQTVADRMLTKIFRDPADWVRRQKKPDVISHAALVQARLWQWTGDTKYVTGANQFLLEVAKARRTLREADFFTVYPFAKTYQLLDEDGQLQPATRNEARAFVEKCFRPRDVVDHNQAFTRACGLALAAQLFPDSKHAASWRRYADDVWKLWMQVGDITENASNYNRIDSIYLFLLADLLGRTDDMKDWRVRAMYTRWRKQVTPSGTIPAYGDSGSGRLEPNPNWPWLNAWGQWVAGFERAGSLYQDGAFRWAATKLFQRGTQDEPLGRRYFHVLALSALMCAADWADEDLKPVLPHEGSAVLTRRDSFSNEAADKLILAPSRRSGAPMVLCDLYARGHHAHVNQHGAIAWYEVNNVPLVANLGYNNRKPHHANALIVRDAQGEFPHRASAFPANQWQTATLPTARMERVENNPHHRRIKELGLRVASRGGVTLWADNLRLAGPAGIRQIESFENPEGWNFSPHRTGQSREGDFGLVWQFPPGTHITFNRAINQRLAEVEFDYRDYPHLLIDWKLSDNSELARPLIVRCGVDYHVHMPQLQPRLVAARVKANKDGDQLGCMTFDHWFLQGARHRRKMLLTREGVLLVVDHLKCRAEHTGHVAGPVWHLGPLSDPQAGSHWFNAVGAKTELLVFFPPIEKQTCGFQTADVWNIRGQRTVFAKQTVGDRPLVFVSLLVPHEPRLTAQQIADKIQIQMRDGKVKATAPLPYGLELTLADESFQVVRENK